jgi:Rod binding domain-containing protein
MASPITSAGILVAQAGLQQSRMTQILQQSTSAANAKEDAKIDKSAQDFEAMLLGTWLQQAEQSFGTVPGAEDDDDAAGRDQMMSLGVQSLAESLAASGGIGIAKMVSKALHATAEKAAEQTEPSSGK